MTASSRSLLGLILAFGALSLRAQQPFDYPLVEDKAITAIRAAGIMDPEGDHEGDPILGFEIGVGSNVYPIDEMIISYGHLEADDINQDYVMFALEERWEMFKGIRPYGAVGVGYMWVDEERGDEVDGVFLKLGGGILITIAPTVRAYAEVEYQLSSDEMWLDDGQFDNRNLQGVAGLRFYY